MWNLTFKFWFSPKPAQFDLYKKKEILFANHGCQLLLFLFVKIWETETNCENLCEVKAYGLVSLLNGDFAESRKTCTKWLSLGPHYSTFYNDCALSCSSPQSLSTINSIIYTYCFSEKENFPNIDFSSLLRKSVCGKIWKDNSRVHPVCFQLRWLQIKWSDRLFFYWESLNNRWVLISTPMNNMNLQCIFRRTTSFVFTEYRATLCWDHS